MASNRKYTPEQIDAEIARPKKRAGRPRKYATEEERAAAMREARKRVYWRKKYASEGLDIPEEFAPRQAKHETAEDRERAQAECRARYKREHAAENCLYTAACRRRSRIIVNAT